MAGPGTLHDQPVAQLCVSSDVVFVVLGDRRQVLLDHGQS